MAEFDETRLSKTEPFYLAVNDADITWESPSAFGSEEEAVGYISDYAESYGGRGIVFKCTPAVEIKPPPRRKARIVRLDGDAERTGA